MDTDLVGFCRNLFFGPEAEYERFQENPEPYLAEAGLSNVTAGEMHEALVLACEAPVVDQGAQVSVGGNQTTAPTVAPTPPPLPPAPAYPEMPATEYVTNVHEYYVTNETITNVDDRDTSINNTNVVNAEEGSTVTIDQETAVSGDGGVSNTGSIEDSQIITGDVSDSTVLGGDIDDTIVGDNNNQANDNDGPAQAGGQGNVQIEDASGNVQIGGEGNVIQDVDGEGAQVANAGGDVEQNQADIQVGGGGGGETGGEDFGRGSALIDQGGDQTALNINVGSGGAEQTVTDDDNIDILSPDVNVEVELPEPELPQAEPLVAEAVEKAPELELEVDEPDDMGMME